MTGQSWVGTFVSAVIALAFTTSILPILLAFRQSRRKLELDHAVRLRAIELGRPLPDPASAGDDEPWTLSARLAIALAVVVPLGALSLAWLASMSLGYHSGIWGAAAMIGMAAVICGSMIAVYPPRATAADGADLSDALKPFAEEDAYDVVSARG